jgi:hypothetical protein
LEVVGASRALYGIEGAIGIGLTLELRAEASTGGFGCGGAVGDAPPAFSSGDLRSERGDFGVVSSHLGAASKGCPD